MDRFLSYCFVMFSETRTLLKEHGGLIVVCFLLIFFSVFGQSLFFGLYLPEIQDSLSLTKTSIGLLYASATVSSAIIVVYSGRKLDVWPLRYFVAFTLIGLAIGCFTMAFSTSMWILFMAFLLLRHFGQGLMSISSTATINRYLDKSRGKATAITNLGGAPAQLMVFPFLVYAMAEYMDWRTAWIFYGIFVLIALLPFFWFSLKSHQRTTHARWEAKVKKDTENTQPDADKHWTVLEVLKDWRIYGLMAISALSPFTGTVIFFYQADLAMALDHTPLIFATSFPFLTFAAIAGSLTAGGLIDTYGEKPALMAYPILYGAGLFFMINGDALVSLYVGMTLVGFGGGMMATTGGPLLAHLYGTKFLSSVKSIMFSSAIVSSALSPLMFGYLMDQGVSILNIFSGIIFYAAVIWIVAIPLCKK